jgi:hypothetical protein
MREKNVIKCVAIEETGHSEMSVLSLRCDNACLCTTHARERPNEKGESKSSRNTNTREAGDPQRAS